MTQPIPDEALNTHLGVLGKTGAGKSYTARGLVERLLHARRQVVIVDPTGAWWGLRTGFDIPIFGGRKGDIEISDATGEAVARVIVEQRTSAIVDLSLMSGGGQQRFMRTFAHRLRAKEPGALWLVIDEADEFLPQHMATDQTNAFGDLKWMVRRGRLNGFRVMMITQRPAEIAKAVLTQIETLVAHRLTAPHDRKAIEEWVKGHHDPAEAREVLTTLASLDKGEAWVWSPDLGLLTRAKMPTIETFDSGRTPEPGETEIAPPALGDLDLSGIREAMASAEPEKAKKGGAGDAELLRLRAERDEWTIERAIGQQQLDALVAEVGALRAIIARIDDAISEARLIRHALDEVPASAGQGGGGHVDRSAERAPVFAPEHAQMRVDRGSTSASPAALAIADLLDRINPARVTWAQAAAMTGRKASGGNFNAARKWLRGSGRIVEEGELIRSSAEASTGMTRDEALDLWRSVLSSPAPKMIDAFVEHGALTKEELGAAIGAQPRGGNFNNGLAQLRRNGLLYEYGSGTLRLAEPLPGEAA